MIIPEIQKIDVSCFLALMFVERLVNYSQHKQKMTAQRGQAKWAKIASLVGKLTTPKCHTTKK
jgi:hypothetical protein